MITLKSPAQIAMLRQSGKILAQTFEYLTPLLTVGTSTEEINLAAGEYIRSQGAQPAFFQYQGFPANICTSIDEVVIHGIPSPTQFLASGNLLSIDIGVNYQGYFTDSAHSYIIDGAPQPLVQLLEATRKSLELAVAAVRVGGRIKDIGKAISSYICPLGYGIVDSYCGHGVGLEIHEDPPIVNVYPSKGSNPRIRNGMVLAIEPMVCLGGPEVDTLDDHFTVVTRDGLAAAHFEHTIAVDNDGVEILA